MSAVVGPVPLPDAASAGYWDAAAAGMLCLPRCTACARLHAPPLPLCPECGSEELVWTAVLGTGVLHSFTVMHREVVAGVTPPYVLVVVELDDQPGLMMSANLSDGPTDGIGIGDRVEVTFEPRGGVRLPQFRIVR